VIFRTSAFEMAHPAGTITVNVHIEETATEPVYAKTGRLRIKSKNVWTGLTVRSCESIFTIGNP
jgi:hypothetical protein